MMKDDKGKCPCGRCEECPLARMVRNNREILLAIGREPDRLPSEHDVEQDAE